MDPQVRFRLNSSLVPLIYHRHFYNYTGHQEDLFQEGYTALWEACNNFDESKGFKFSTYACVAIQHKMSKYVKRVIQKHSSVLSLEEIVVEDGEGNALYLKDTLYEEQDNSAKYAIQETLKKLSDKDAKIICRLMEGYTQNQISKMCNTSQSYVSRCLNRFKTLLLEELN